MGTIRSVIPLEGYRLLIELNTGSSITVDLLPKLKTVRFAELKDQKIFQDVRTDSETVIWGDGVLKIPVFELIDVAVGSM
jgi:hypothetical protein